MNFAAIQKNYNKGLWSKSMVKIAVKKGILTREQYDDIVGEAYL